MINRIIDKSYEITLKNNLLTIKYYKNIDSILSNKIIINLEDKILIVNGNDLMIVCMDEYELCIRGNIKNIELSNE